MCMQDYLLKRQIKTRYHNIDAAGAGIVLRLQYDRARWGILISGTTASTLQWSASGFNNINAVITKVATTASEIKYLTYDMVGAFIWEPMDFRMTAAGQASVVELFLPTDYDSMKQILANLT